MPFSIVILKSASIVESVLSNDGGQEIDHFSENGTVDVSGEEPPPEAPDTPTGLVAVAGDSEISLSWNPSFGAEEYLVYREEGSSGTLNYPSTSPIDFILADLAISISDFTILIALLYLKNYIMYT